MECNLPRFSFVSYAFDVVSGKILLNTRSHKYNCMFSSKSFVVLFLTFRFMINFELIFEFSIYNTSFFFCMLISSCSSPICGKDYSFPIELFWHPCWKSIGHKCISLFLDSELCSTDLYVYPFASITVLIAVALCSKFWNWEVWFLKFYSSLQDDFGYSGSLEFP